jgi:2',3'-cyclic-nucleotide 2'-phosphodiesterase/3'-nucleotidase/5'-nucleotidase
MNTPSIIRRKAPAWVALILATSLCQVSAGSTKPGRSEKKEKPERAEKNIGLAPLGTYATGIYNEGSAGIVVHDPATQWLYVINGKTFAVDVLSIADPTQPVKLGSVQYAQPGVTPYGIPRSVALRRGVLALSFQASPKTDPGAVVFLVASLDETRAPGDQIVAQALSAVTVGALPDMITFTPNGRYLLVANEGEPNSYNNVQSETLGPSVDPEGSISIIDVTCGVAHLTQNHVRTADFRCFNNDAPALRAAGIRIFGPNASVAQDLEPEYIAVSRDSRTAWVTLQENNALATIDLRRGEVTELVPLGTKDHSLGENGFGSSNALDASDQDGGNNILTWPVKGLYQPDAIAAYTFRGHTFLVMANEGDVRSYPGLLPPPASGSEDIRIGSADFVLNPDIFPAALATFLKNNTNLGRLQTSRLAGDLDGDGTVDEIHTFGGRSFSIRRSSGELVFDSGDQFEQITATLFPTNFNANNSNNTRDTRSDDSGPEPEGLVLGKAFGRQWAFIGLERMGGVMVYDVTNPYDVRFVNYVNNRNFSVTPNAANIPPKPAPNTGDLAPEALIFINAERSPTGKPLLVVTSDVSGTTTVFEVTKE